MKLVKFISLLFASIISLSSCGQSDESKALSNLYRSNDYAFVCPGNIVVGQEKIDLKSKISAKIGSNNDYLVAYNSQICEDEAFFIFGYGRNYDVHDYGLASFDFKTKEVTILEYFLLTNYIHEGYISDYVHRANLYWSINLAIPHCDINYLELSFYFNNKDVKETKYYTLYYDCHLKMMMDLTTVPIFTPIDFNYQINSEYFVTKNEDKPNLIVYKGEDTFEITKDVLKQDDIYGAFLKNNPTFIEDDEQRVYITHQRLFIITRLIYNRHHSSEYMVHEFDYVNKTARFIGHTDSYLIIHIL